MKILFIMHYFQPEPNFFMGLPFAKELLRRGHQVQVLTGFPNYPGGKLYDGYKQRLLQREKMEGVPVIRVPLYPSHDRSSFKRILCYASLAFSQSFIGTFAIDSADVAYVCQGPATIGLPASIIKLFRRVPFVYNIQDLWPDSLSATGMFDSSLGLRLVNSWCKYVYKRAAKIIPITPGMRKRLIQRGVSDDKVEVIHNWCDNALISRVEPDFALAENLGMKEKFNIVFAGNMGKAQAVEAVLNAAKLLVDSCPNLQFVFFGGGVEVGNLKKKTELLGLNNVLFHGRKPISEIGPILRLADVLLVHLRDNPLFQITIPSKTQAYMAIGRPILIGVRGDAADLVKKANAGICVEPENSKSIAEGVKKLYLMTQTERQKLGDNGIGYYDENLSFSTAVDRYEKIFEDVRR